MKSAVLIDTDVLIDAGRQVAEAVACLKAREQSHSLHVSVITEMELIVGCRDNRELHALQTLLDRFRILQISEGASATAAGLVRKYRLSHGLLIPDALIAATALMADLPLITKNKKDYRFIEGLKLSRYPW